jgi:hypothetical protein
MLPFGNERSCIRVCDYRDRWNAADADQGAEDKRLRLNDNNATRELFIGASRRERPPIEQSFHPTRVVAGVGTAWHASAHKGSSFFRRRAPALITADPRGSPDAAPPHQETRVGAAQITTKKEVDRWKGGRN